MMENNKVTILNGLKESDSDLIPILDILVDEFEAKGAIVQVFDIKKIKLAHCIGCFGCWVKTPGVCIMSDAGRDIIRTIIQSDTVILFTPVTFGGYSSDLKIIVDRFIPLVLPYFGKYHGEIHHLPRYPSYPRWIGIGVQRRVTPETAKIFKFLVGRNAINFHAPSYAAEVIVNTDDPQSIRRQLQTAFSRKDNFPQGTMITPLEPVPGQMIKGSKRALLVIGSPKIKSSNSGMLGTYLLECLKEHGWKTESLTLKPSLLQEQGINGFFPALNRSNLLILAFPLYIDSLPVLVTKALEIISTHRQEMTDPQQLQLLAISNNGFPEAYQNTLALAICHRFAVESHINWVGSLKLGAGEVMVNNQPLKNKDRSGPPVKHVIQALDLTAQALSEGNPFSLRAQKLMGKIPISVFSLNVWRWFFVREAGKHWQRLATENGIDKNMILEKPYLKDT